jgi:hypothetical protein
VAKGGRLSARRASAPRVTARATAAQLVGAWKLTSMRFEFSDNGERVDMFGPHPRGRLILTSGGLMIAVITPDDRPRPKQDANFFELFQNLCAYSGHYRIDGDNFITDVDVAWHPAWEGSAQKRTFKIDGDSLWIATEHTNRPTYYPGRAGRGVLMWERE